MDGRDEAHKEWLKQRQQMLNELEDAWDTLFYINRDVINAKDTIFKAIEFIKQGEI